MNLEGYRTYIIGLVGALLGIANNLAPGVVPLLDETQVNALIAILWPLLMLIMRKVTKAPPAL